MTERTAPVHETDLMAYADGRLDPARRAEVEAWLVLNPDRLAEVQHIQRQNEALIALFGPVANEPVPERLQPRLLARQRAKFRPTLMQMATAAMIVLALGGALGWAGRDLFDPPETAGDTLIGSAVTAHELYVKENRHAVEVAANEREHLFSWLSNRIARPITPPDLSAEGFELVGGRLLPSDYDLEETGPAAQLMYENAAAERVTVYITAALPDGARAYEFATRDRLDAFYWANDRITCTVVGDLPEAAMKAVAKKVYQQLSWRPDGESTLGT